MWGRGPWDSGLVGMRMVPEEWRYSGEVLLVGCISSTVTDTAWQASGTQGDSPDPSSSRLWHRSQVTLVSLSHVGEGTQGLLYAWQVLATALHPHIIQDTEGSCWADGGVWVPRSREGMAIG